MQLTNNIAVDKQLAVHWSFSRPLSFNWTALRCAFCHSLKRRCSAAGIAQLGWRLVRRVDWLIDLIGQFGLLLYTHIANHRRPGTRGYAVEPWLNCKFHLSARESSSVPSRCFNSLVYVRGRNSNALETERNSLKLRNLLIYGLCKRRQLTSLTSDQFDRKPTELRSALTALGFSSTVLLSCQLVMPPDQIIQRITKNSGLLCTSHGTCKHVTLFTLFGACGCRY